MPPSGRTLASSELRLYAIWFDWGRCPLSALGVTPLGISSRSARWVRHVSLPTQHPHYGKHTNTRNMYMYKCAMRKGNGSFTPDSVRYASTHSHRTRCRVHCIALRYSTAMHDIASSVSERQHPAVATRNCISEKKNYAQNNVEDLDRVRQFISVELWVGRCRIVGGIRKRGTRDQHWVARRLTVHLLVLLFKQRHIYCWRHQFTCAEAKCSRALLRRLSGWSGLAAADGSRDATFYNTDKLMEYNSRKLSRSTNTYSVSSSCIRWTISKTHSLSREKNDGRIRTSHPQGTRL